MTSRTRMPLSALVARLQTAAEGPGPSPSSVPRRATPAPPTGSSGLDSTTTPGASPPRSRPAASGPGVHVGVLGPTSRALVTTIQAVFLAGGTVVALPLPMRLGSIEEFVEQTRAAISNADAALVVVDPTSRRSSTPVPGRPARGAARRARRRGRGAGRAWDRPPDDPERLAILQFTSGSTAEPKGVMLPHRCVRRTSTPSSPAARPRRPTAPCRGCRSTTTWASSGC